MSLASRCPTCGTVFRVVPDQLRVSQGWVRCGRCGEAFNAIEAMVPTPAPDEALAPEHAATLVAPAPAEARPEDERAVSAAPAAVEPAAPTLAEPTPEPAAPAAAGASDGIPGDSDGDGAVALGPDAADDTVFLDLPPAGTGAEDGHAGDDDPAQAAPASAPSPPPPSAAPPTRPQDRAQGPDVADSEPHPAPSFVVQADRAARWQRPGVRLMLSLAAGLAALGLVAQAGLAWRDRLAVSTPALKPWLQQACATLGCRIDDYRQINALSVEASGLVRAEGASTYRLSLTLRNRAAIDVAAPALDLTLTDSQGQTLARRVLTMQDLQLPLRTLKAGSELPIQVPLAITGRPISGYTVELFYP
ncbi:zinc-ribbon and DUF3426 domain-containing protein [Pseudorhodoferax sp.]|uniref:zinc-ribbon and DUF3426 domain-containing protein n=1 Tax=Pseudorhodoferax sp. TaxID=1993553 RepID=UPI002DD63BD6|nr:zinc-ribbon and DUF3426 domain-containing protein [Pseudorhodoferax sp.]